MNTINIIGIDPGSNNLGVGILTVDLKDFKIVKIKTIPINLKLSIPNTNIFKPDLLYKLTILRNIIRKIMVDYKPMFVAMETSFINKNRLGAVIPLTQSINTIKLEIYEIDILVKIFDYSPAVIKKSLAIDFKDKRDEKDKMFDAVNDTENISKLIDLNTLTEHEVDGIAIAYTHLKYIKENKEVLCLM